MRSWELPQHHFIMCRRAKQVFSFDKNPPAVIAGISSAGHAKAKSARKNPIRVLHRTPADWIPQYALSVQLFVWTRGRLSNMKYYFQYPSTIFTFSCFVEMNTFLYFILIWLSEKNSLSIHFEPGGILVLLDIVIIRQILPNCEETCPIQTARYGRNSRVSPGHIQTVQYIVSMNV